MMGFKKKNNEKKLPDPLQRAGVRLKICGMKYPENIASVAALKPDYMGFIFYEQSLRNFEGDIPEISKNIKRTGVFVNAPIAYILDKIQRYNLHAVQLHGQESADYCEELKRHYEEQSDQVISSKKMQPHNTRDRNDDLLEIIKAFSIKDRFEFEVLKPYEKVCDYYLFDTKGKLPGGNGYTFDWSVLNEYPSKKPFFLSGGIGSEAVENILSFLQKKESHYCYAIDVNSKFEVEPGLKDIEKLKEFISNLSC